MSFSSVVIHDLDVFGTRRCPAEADAELIVDADAVLARALAPECLKAVAGRNPEVFQAAGDLSCRSLRRATDCDVHESPYPPAPREGSVSASLNETIMAG